MIYLDNNSTIKIDSDVASYMFQLMKEHPYNPSSIHGIGRQARSLMEKARNIIAKTLNISGRIIFTSSGTEANNLLVNGLNDYIFIVSATDHISLLKPASSLGENFHELLVDNDGMININHLESLLEKNKGKKIIISVMLANNETGIINDLNNIVLSGRRYGALIHSDISQAVGKISVNISELGIDFATISSHKIGGPVGAGALIIPNNIHINPQIVGGGQEQSTRAGTENVVAICGFAKAVADVEDKISTMNKQFYIRNYLEDNIKKFCPEAIIFGKNSYRLPNTSCIYMPGVSNETQIINFDLEGIAVSAGAACSSGKITPSHVLTAMGFAEEAKNAIRVSMGYRTSASEIECFLRTWKKLYNQINKDKGQIIAA